MIISYSIMINNGELTFFIITNITITPLFRPLSLHFPCSDNDSNPGHSRSYSTPMIFPVISHNNESLSRSPSRYAQRQLDGDRRQPDRHVPTPTIPFPQGSNNKNRHTLNSKQYPLEVSFRHTGFVKNA